MVYANCIPGQAPRLGAASQHKMNSLFCFGVWGTTVLFLEKEGEERWGSRNWVSREVDRRRESGKSWGRGKHDQNLLYEKPL